MTCELSHIQEESTRGGDRERPLSGAGPVERTVEPRVTASDQPKWIVVRSDGTQPKSRVRDQYRATGGSNHTERIRRSCSPFDLVRRQRTAHTSVDVKRQFGKTIMCGYASLPRMASGHVWRRDGRPVNVNGQPPNSALFLLP